MTVDARSTRASTAVLDRTLPHILYTTVAVLPPPPVVPFPHVVSGRYKNTMTLYATPSAGASLAIHSAVPQTFGLYRYPPVRTTPTLACCCADTPHHLPTTSRPSDEKYRSVPIYLTCAARNISHYCLRLTFALHLSRQLLLLFRRWRCVSCTYLPARWSGVVGLPPTTAPHAPPHHPPPLPLTPHARAACLTATPCTHYVGRTPPHCPTRCRTPPPHLHTHHLFT